MKRNDYIFLTGGLGNQLFQWAAIQNNGLSKVYLVPNRNNARRSKSNNLDIEDFDLGNNTAIYSGRMISGLNLRVINYILRRYANFTPSQKLKIRDHLINTLASLSVTINFLKFTIVKANLGLGYSNIGFSDYKVNVLWVGYFQSYKFTEEASAQEILKGISLRTDNRDLVEYRALSEVEKPLVVHVRMGDYKLADAFGILPSEYYESAITEALKNAIFGRIWLFSDTPGEALEKIPQQFRHMVRLMPDFEGSTPVTFEAMRMGHGFVIANSTFSWWAAYLAHRSEVEIYCPQKWFMRGADPACLLPESWAQIASW